MVMTTPGGRYVGPYTILHSKPIYENQWLKLREDRVQRLGGEEFLFSVVAMRAGVTVLPMEENGDVHLVKEFKYGIGQETLEAVSGAIESGENAETAGLRELSEEAGLIASEWVDMGVINPFTTIVNSPNHTFLARKLAHSRRLPQAGEKLEVVRMPFEDALRAVLKGEITHAASCVLILKTQLFLEKERKGRR
jgi:ADP-ribose pyrophosphatase